jgi:hypothetical protein
MRWHVISTVVALAIAVAGCQTLNDVAGVVGVGSKDGGTAEGTAPKPAAQTAALPGGAAPTGAALSGMTADNLRSLWGEPTLKRTEPGAELWQYGGSGGCTLLIYLYPGASDAMTVSRAEAVPGGADEASVAACAKAAGKPPLTPVS